ncbi:MAG TPA: hypothetical protein VGO93_13720 [Candidatus Xenobia bacterium]
MPTAPLHHEHKPPHGGTLIELGEEFAHIEMTVDPASGHVTAYVLDGEAEQPVTVAQSTLVIHFASLHAPDLVLQAVPNVLTGETVGHTSQFDGELPLLKTTPTFDAELKEILARGTQFRAVRFNYPHGNG